MNRYLLSSAFAGLALVAPVAASAQTLPAAVIAVVDRDRIAATCTQCVAASAQLRTQVQQYQARETQLTTPLQTESQAIQAAINALPQGSQPDAALRTRVQTFQTNQEAAQRELAEREQTLRRNQQDLESQILQRMDPLIGQVTRERGANLALDVATALAHNPALNVTEAVLTLMNQNAAPFSTIAPPAQQPAASPTSARPAATPATTPQPPRPRPQGR